MVALLSRLPVRGKVLVTLDAANENVYLSARNQQKVSTLPATSLSTRELLRHDFLLATVPAIRAVEQWLAPSNRAVEAEAGTDEAPKRARARRAAPSAEAAEAPTAQAETEAAAPKRATRARASAAETPAEADTSEKPRRTRAKPTEGETKE
jgi:hypothetical protein